MITRRTSARLTFRSPGVRRLVVISCFALNLLLGYLAMLVVMTYSFELFFSVIVGLVAGHSFFNWNSAVGESVDPCCSNQNDVCQKKSGCDDACAMVNLIRHTDNAEEEEDVSTR